MPKKREKPQPANVFTYTDFRLFIRDRYLFLKSRDRSLTYKKIGEKSGFASPGFFTQIMQGKSRLPFTMIRSLCDALMLNQKERRYFSLLVDYGQEQSHRRKHELFKRVLNGNTALFRTVAPDQYELFDKWYYSAIHELLFFYPFSGDYHALAKKLEPSIAPSEAKAAIELLTRLGLIRKKPDAAFVRSDADHLTTGFHSESVVINNYLLEMMALARSSVETQTPDARSLSTVTLSLSEEGYRRMERELHECRRRLLALAQEDSNEDRLYQINLQMFPLTRIEKKAPPARTRAAGTRVSTRGIGGQNGSALPEADAENGEVE
jgi:uncharacterized protein (TIGR02147 family)